jgi:hypothetical protein
MSSAGGSSSGKSEYAPEQREQREQREQFITARNEGGQFLPFGKEKEPEPTGPGGHGAGHGLGKGVPSADMSNMLRHIEQLEGKLSAKEKQLLDAQQRVEKFSARTREGMQSALDSLMKKWMDACETKDEKCKEQFKHGMEKLVANSAEENGVWQMMVAASALHQRQEHDLDKLRGENTELRQKIDGHYATPGARTRDDVLGKRKADADPASDEDGAASLWSEFAKECAGF